MSVKARPVTKENWYVLARLKVREDQTHFVAPNVYSIAEAQFGIDYDEGHWELCPFGIYDGDLPVGFFMYGLNLEGVKWQAFVVRLMVDMEYQGRGYGSFGLQTMIETFRADPLIRSVGISYEPENETARRLYAKHGFVETDEMIGGEVVATLRLF